jgi:predicted DNA-binding transcriptional regulator AlpA
MPTASDILAAARVRGPNKPRVALPAAVLDDAQVSTLTGFSIPTIKRWRKAGKIPGVMSLNGRPRYRAADIRAWVDGERAVAVAAA